MKAALRSIVITALVMSLAAAVLGWFFFVRARDENRALAARLQSVKLPAEAGTRREQNDDEELSRLRRENQEVLRLRSEISELRGLKAELEQLRRENQELRGIIDSERDRVQAQWATWVSSLRTNAMKADDVFALVQALTNEVPSIRVEATKVLRQIGLQRLLATNLTAEAELDLRNTARVAVPGLVSALKDSDTFVRANAAITLGFLDEAPDVVVPALTECLNDEQLRVAGAAAKALGRFQGRALSSVPALLRAAQSADEGLRESAITALKQIDPATARKAGFELSE